MKLRAGSFKFGQLGHRCPGSANLLAKISPGKSDKDGLKARFSNRQVAEAVRIRLPNDIGQQTLSAMRKDADSPGNGLDTDYAGELLEPLNQRRKILLAVKV